jgi:GWxTD domain-containing protein
VIFGFAAMAQNAFKVDFDYSRFFYDDSSGYLEIYYAFFEPDLLVTAEDDQNVIKGFLNIQLKNLQNDQLILDRDFRFTNVVDTELSSGNKSLTGNLGFLVPFGEYLCMLTGKDGSDLSKIDTISFQVSIMELPSERFSISDIELASSIKQSDNVQSMFYKNTYEVIPNPSSIYGEALPVIYFYTEMYNLDYDIKSPLLKIEHLLINSRNQAVVRKPKLVSRKTSSIVEVGAINITKIPSGTYTLALSATDSLKNMTIYSSKKIFIYNPSVADEAAGDLSDMDVLSSEFAAMSEEELDENFSVSKYIATTPEIVQWAKLSEPDAKKNFLFNFWKARDVDVTTGRNEFKREYFRRIAWSNDRYTTIQKKGWKTDRGRVYIIFGEPSEIERYPNQVDTKPYEIWRFDQIEGGVVFVFADLSGFNDYTLIHSTKRGELLDENWMRRISTY